MGNKGLRAQSMVIDEVVTMPEPDQVERDAFGIPIAQREAHERFQHSSSIILDFALWNALKDRKGSHVESEMMAAMQRIRSRKLGTSATTGVDRETDVPNDPAIVSLIHGAGESDG